MARGKSRYLAPYKAAQEFLKERSELEWLHIGNIILTHHWTGHSLYLEKAKDHTVGWDRNTGCKIHYKSRATTHEESRSCEVVPGLPFQGPYMYPKTVC